MSLSPSPEPSFFYGDGSYSPAPTPGLIDLVDVVHDFPRGDYSSKFATNKDYYSGLVFIGALAAAIGIVLVLFYLLVIACRCCNTWCRLNVQKIENGKECCGAGTQRCMLFFWLISTGLLMCLCYLGREKFQSGLEKITLKTAVIVDVFDELNDYGTDLLSYSDEMQVYDGDLNCTYADDFGDIVGDFQDAVDDMISYWDGVNVDFKKINRVIENDAPSYIDYGLGAVVALVLLVVILGFLGLVCHWLCFLDLLGFFGTIVLLLLCLLVGLELGLLVGIGDYCENGPDNSFLAIMSGPLKVHGDNYDLIEYYVRCAGENPVSDSLITSEVMLQEYKDTIQTAIDSGVCDASILQDMKSVLGSTNSTLHEIETTMSCGNINPIYQTVSYEVLCDDVISGLYLLTTVMLPASIMLFIGLFTTVYVRERMEIEKGREDERAFLGASNDFQL